jgi:hypothetical protein
MSSQAEMLIVEMLPCFEVVTVQMEESNCSLAYCLNMQSSMNETSYNDKNLFGSKQNAALVI